MIPCEEAKLLQRAAEWTDPDDDLDSLGSARLLEITRIHGLDFATALLYDRIFRKPENADFLQRTKLPPSSPLRPQLVGVVPAAFYREMPVASASRILAILNTLGCEAELIPLLSLGEFDENAGIISAWVRSHRDRSITLISLSKGSADLKTAMATRRDPAEWASVTDWISISGMAQGSPLVEWLRKRPLRWWGVRLLLWFLGHKAGALAQMERTPEMEFWPDLPPHLRVYHVYGLPLRQHLHHRFSRRGYNRLAPLGPNDGGGILLGSLSKLPGVIFPIWGADHYLSPSWDLDSLLRDVIATVMSAPLHASQSAANPSNPPASRSSA